MSIRMFVRLLSDSENSITKNDLDFLIVIPKQMNTDQIYIDIGLAKYLCLSLSRGRKNENRYPTQWAILRHIF